MLIEGLISYLAADTGLQAALGIPSARIDKTTGIFPTIAPERCPMPYVTAQQIAGEPLQTSFQGTGRLQSARWRFSAYGTTYKQAKGLATALRFALNGLDGTVGDCFVQGCWLQMEADDAEPIPHGTIYSTHVDYSINFTELAG